MPTPPSENSSNPALSSVDQNRETGQGTGGIPDGAFPEIYERHVAEVLRYAIRCAGRREIAEELTSEAFLKLYAHRQNVDPSRAIAWLMTTVKNLAIDHWRRAEVERRTASQVQVKAPAVEWPAGMERPTFQKLLTEAHLKPEHRVCLTLHYVHGMDRQEITSHTGLTPNQVKSSIQYGLRLLREALAMSIGGRREP